MSFDFKKPLSHYYKLSPKKTWLKARLEAFLKEIKDWGLPTNINFQFGDEWYYAEGSNLISIPFYLSDPALARSLSLRNCLIEGLKPHDFNKLLRHEYGHYFDTAF